MKNKNIIVVLGKNSQLGKTLKYKKLNNIDLKFLTRFQCDIKKKTKVEYYVKKYKPKILINFASYNNVKKSEKSKDAYYINSLAVKNLNDLCIKYSIFFIHFSSDYVFDGKKKSYLEKDRTNPLNAYGISKNKGEKFILNSKNNNFSILRVSWLFSKYNNNFLKKIKKKIKAKKNFSVVNDQIGVPTSAEFVVNILIKIIKYYLKGKKLNKIYHLSPRGYTSRYNFAKIIWKKLNIKNSYKYKNVLITPKKTDNSDVVKRPYSTILVSNKIQTMLKLKFKNWNNYLKI